jgi:hypothetical protein
VRHRGALVPQLRVAGGGLGLRVVGTPFDLTSVSLKCPMMSFTYSDTASGTSASPRSMSTSAKALLLAPAPAPIIPSIAMSDAGWATDVGTPKAACMGMPDACDTREAEHTYWKSMRYSHATRARGRMARRMPARFAKPGPTTHHDRLGGSDDGLDPGVRAHVPERAALHDLGGIDSRGLEGLAAKRGILRVAQTRRLQKGWRGTDAKKGWRERGEVSERRWGQPRGTLAQYTACLCTHPDGKAGHSG